MAMVLVQSMGILPVTLAQRQSVQVSCLFYLLFLHLLTLVHAGDGTKPRFLEPFSQSQGGGNAKYRYYCTTCMLKDKVSKKKLNNIGSRSSQYSKLSFSAGITLFKSQYQELGQWQQQQRK